MPSCTSPFPKSLGDSDQASARTKVAVYLRAPNPCCPRGRTPKGATGNWYPVPPDRVTVSLCGGAVVVVVE